MTATAQRFPLDTRPPARCILTGVNQQRVELRIHGFVQGVGFRSFAARQARALGLTGEVRNRTDGAVEVVAEGARDDLERLIELLRVGPRPARVAGVQAEWSEGMGRYREFRITG